jgi:hypothetical protein
MSDCSFCNGRGDVHASECAYLGSASGWAVQRCPRCGGSGKEPSEAGIHIGLLLRSRNGKVWAVYSPYPGNLASPRTDHAQAWGIHRMKPSRLGGCYVWQIRVLGEDALLDRRRWTPAGVGDAWMHDRMEAPPLVPSGRGGEGGTR